MLITFQGRLRIPCKGSSSMQVSFGTLLPAIVIPLTIGVAAINLYVTIILSIFGLAFVSYVHYYVTSRNIRSRFFCLWIFWSVVYMTVFFEFTVPLLELLPEENLILVLLTSFSLLCLWRTQKRSAANINSKAGSSDITDNIKYFEENDQTALLIENDMKNDKFEEPICKSCHMNSTTNHCTTCSSCHLGWHHHSYWLNCCIGVLNYRLYISGLVLAELALLLGANLTLTAICHPFLILRLGNIPVMLPDDCSEIYYDYKQGISFVIAVYALIMATFILATLMWELFRVLRGHSFILNGHKVTKNCTNWR